MGRRCVGAMAPAARRTTQQQVALPEVTVSPALAVAAEPVRSAPRLYVAVTLHRPEPAGRTKSSVLEKGRLPAPPPLDRVSVATQLAVPTGIVTLFAPGCGSPLPAENVSVETTDDSPSIFALDGLATAERVVGSFTTAELWAELEPEVPQLRLSPSTEGTARSGSLNTANRRQVVEELS